MENSLQIAQKKINLFSPDLLDHLLKVMDDMLAPKHFPIPQFQMEEVMDRLQFHRKNPSSNLYFFENIEDLEYILA